MIWFIIYMIGAAVSVFTLCAAKNKTCEKTTFNEDFFFMAPILCGAFWPIAMPIYGAYLAAIWFSEKSNN